MMMEASSIDYVTRTTSTQDDFHLTQLPPPSSSSSMLRSMVSTAAADAVPPLTSVRDGCCPTCGIQLYKIKKGLLSRKPFAKPLTTVDGHVVKGHCLACADDDHTTSNSRQESPVDTTTTCSRNASSSSYNSLGATMGDTVYIGDFNIYGQRHGPGELIWNNGDRFAGNFSNGHRDGHGTLFFGDGSEYAGSWEFNKMHGEGTRRFTNGDTFTGKYVDGLRSGSGKMYFADGDLYNGTWKNDQMHGEGGKYHYACGKSFEGTFYNGQRQGKGKIQHVSGKLDILRFGNDRPEGQGVRWSADRSKAWLLTKNGRCKKKRISTAQAVSIGYQCEAGERGEPELAVGTTNDPGASSRLD